MRTLKRGALVLLVMTSFGMTLRAIPISCGFRQDLGIHSHLETNCSYNPPLYKYVEHEVL